MLYEVITYFGITDLLNPKSAKAIYDKTSELFATEEYRVKGLLQKMNVVVACTTDDPIDNLEHHKACVNSSKTKVLPTWRPDKAFAVDNVATYNQYLDKLAEAADTHISTYENLLNALRKRQQYFADNGCVLSDHGIEEFAVADYTENEIENIFAKARTRISLTDSYNFV